MSLMALSLQPSALSLQNVARIVDLGMGRTVEFGVSNGRVSATASVKTNRVALLSLTDYVKLAAPEPEVLKIIGEESKRKGTSDLTSREIDRVIRSARASIKTSESKK